MFDYILDHFCNDSNFINDIDGLKKYLYSLDLSNEEIMNILEDVFKYNDKMHSLMIAENKDLSKVIAKSKVDNTVKELVCNQNITSEKEDNIITLDIDVKKYVDRIRMIKSYEEIKNILPAKGSLNYSHIINNIILGLYEDIIDYKKMLITDKKDMTLEDLKDIKTEIMRLRLKINYLKNISKNTVTLIETEAESINTLLFLKTSSGNYSIFSDLKEIASEHYYLFHTLLTEILEDKFRNIKQFNNNNSIQRMMEIKYNQARITFVPVAKNKYVILDMFIKKTQIDAGYQASLKNKYELFKENYSTIINLLSNEEYLEENKKVLNELLSTLEKDCKVKKLGGHNE